MTRRHALTPEQVAEVKRLYEPGKFGYGSIRKHFAALGVIVGESTIRDALTGRTGYAA